MSEAVDDRYPYAYDYLIIPWCCGLGKFRLCSIFLSVIACKNVRQEKVSSLSHLTSALGKMASTTTANLLLPQLDTSQEAPIQLLSASDHDTTPDEGQEDGLLPEEDVQSTIGVSMSHAHTRLMSPRTPVAERAAAIDTLDIGGLFDGTAESQPQEEEVPSSNGPGGAIEPMKPQVSNRRHSEESLQPLPSPWTASPKAFEKYQPPARKQSTSKGLISGPASMLADLNVKRFVSSFNLPSLPKTPNWKDISLPNVSSVLSGKDGTQAQRTRQKRARTLQPTQHYWNDTDLSGPGRAPNGTEERKPVAKQQSSVVKENQISTMQPSNEMYGSNFDLSELSSENKCLPRVRTSSDGPPLRRTMSDQSLSLHRVTSAKSWLGDDTRWEHVQEQVNSRMQAFKDTLQDSNIKLPSLPTLSNISLNNLRPEFLRLRGTSDSKMTMADGHSDGGPSALHGVAIGNMDQRHHYGQKTIEEDGIRRSPKSNQPNLDRALETLTGDVIVLGGYRGSILRSAKPPHRQLWVPVKVGLNIRKVNLEVGLEPEDEENMHEAIVGSEMLSHIGPIDMGRRLLKRLRSSPNAQEGRLRIHDYGYDWRLSPHLLSRRFIDFLDKLPSNAEGVPKADRGAIVIAHSLGGLITRHAVNQRPELFAGVVYAGTPQHCINILGPMRNGDEVLLSSKVLTAQVNFTLRTSFLLLPDDGHCFINKWTKEEYPVDFFKAENWRTYALSPCVAPNLPPYGPPAEKKGILNTVYSSLPSLPAPLKRPLLATAEATTTASTPPTNPSIACTIPLPTALAYLSRTLASIALFRSQLSHYPPHTASNAYPPISILYSTSIPTVFRARVACREAIKHADAYDDLQFASGDGVVLARAAMVPSGYNICEGGRVRSERGHVGLLGDGDGVGRCLIAVLKARREKGVGLGQDS